MSNCPCIFTFFTWNFLARRTSTWFQRSRYFVPGTSSGTVTLACVSVDGRVRRTDDRRCHVVVHVQRGVGNPVERRVVDRVLTRGAADGSRVSLPAAAQLNAVRQRIGAGQLELRRIRDVQLA